MGVFPHGWTARCDVKGCHWWSHASTQEKAETAMEGHMAWAHASLATPPAASEGDR